MLNNTLYKDNMKKVYTLLITLAALCFLSGTASATSVRTDATLSAAASSCTATGTVCLISPVDVTQGGATFTVSTNASNNTIQFEASGDGGGTWVALSVTPSNSTTTVTSTTATGTWQANVAGFTNVRLRMSTLAGGTNLVSIAQSSASARTNGGGVAASVAFSGITGGTNTTAAMIIGTGASLAFTGTATLDLSADTAAAAFKVPVGAGFTSSADGVINYDSTAKNTHFRVNGADALGVGEASAIANGFIPMSSSATISLLTATFCDQGITTANTLTCTNTSGLKVVAVATGTSPPTCTVGTAGTACLGEGTAPTGAASVDMLYANSTNHCLDALNNNVEKGCLAWQGALQTFTGLQTFTNGVAATTIDDVNGNAFILSSATGSAVDSITVTNAATANPATVTVASSGSDTNVNLALNAKGSGVVQASTFETMASNRVVMTADWTCGTGGTVSTCVAATIVGSTGTPMTFTLPLQALSWDFDCDGVVGQATAATANTWNVITATNGATNVTASYTMLTAATATTGGATTDTASTTTTIVVGPAWTLGGTATKMPFHLHARIEGASASGTVLSLQIAGPAVGDLVTIYRGMSCWVR